VFFPSKSKKVSFLCFNCKIFKLNSKTSRDSKNADLLRIRIRNPAHTRCCWPRMISLQSPCPACLFESDQSILSCLTTFMPVIYTARLCIFVLSIACELSKLPCYVDLSSSDQCIVLYTPLSCLPICKRAIYTTFSVLCICLQAINVLDTPLSCLHICMRCI